ncbi:magnesium transporter [Vibrio sp. IB15]|uniref:Magnesium transporter n=1 Tax=Vibrio chagasii TaxID=170679 RepID=A0A7V7NQD9_9VIBR|nr:MULTISPECIES: magnesium transporter [Vibrio]KAB0471029.1 magnesium transporter [Vibrio chagasii]MBJ2148002.1 magnesium transporter [Vibrio sp. IB15]
MTVINTVNEYNHHQTVSFESGATQVDFTLFNHWIEIREIQKLNQHFNAEYIQQALCFTPQLSAESLQRLCSLEGFDYQQDVELFLQARHPVIHAVNSAAMTVLYHDMSVEQAKKALNSLYVEFACLTIVDDMGRFVGLIKLDMLFKSQPDLKLSEIVHHAISCHFSASQEHAVALLKQSRFDVVPILNSQGLPVGLLSAKSAIDIVTEEQTEDMERLMGIQQDGHVGDYMNLSVMDHVSKRIVWVIGLAILGLLSGMVIHSYEDAIEAFTVLALYMPMIADSGGNAGTQSATVMVRSLALGSIKLRDWLSVLWKETRIAIVIGGALAFITLGKVSLLSYGVELPANLTLTMLGCAIGLALFFQIVSSTVIGAMLPMMTKRLNLDPAVVASPAITTIVDIGGLLIYFFCTTRLLGLS